MKTIIAATLALGFAAPAFAESHEEKVPQAVEARQGVMQVQGMSLGVVGNMARGNAPYDAAAAQAAADDLLAVSNLTIQSLWPEGTSNEEVPSSDALPAIWTDWEGFETAYGQLQQAAANLAEVAGDGPEALGEAVGMLGRTCGGCHDDYRLKRE
ncbi:cytochrome c [Jannaschia sp. W003]|uniref:c-type cytochrome n=1 Tax=Jannaschia sp. W003 TaxID=2867012 RepID=UPI0021A809B7|nr:cytochrome c [Jannaschia sp. W003]UWQ20307.1 cytochrome c [Jannaschia sp. W003]